MILFFSGDCTFAYLTVVGADYDVQLTHHGQIGLANVAFDQRPRGCNVSGKGNSRSPIDQRLIDGPVLVHLITCSALVIFKRCRTIGRVSFFCFCAIVFHAGENFILRALRRIAGGDRKQAIQITILLDNIDGGLVGFRHRYQVVGERKFQVAGKLTDPRLATMPTARVITAQSANEINSLVESLAL